MTSVVIASLVCSLVNPVEQVAILPVRLPSDVRVSDLVNDVVIDAVRAAGNFRVIGTNDFDVVLSKEQTVALLACRSVQCHAEIANHLGARRLVTVDVERTSAGWLATGTAMDLTRLELDSKRLMSIKGDAVVLVAELPELIASLFEPMQSRVKPGRLKVDCAEAETCLAIARTYRDGDGVPQSFEKAVAHFDKACDLGEPRGCASLASRYANGTGVKRDAGRAVVLWDKACAMGDGRACVAAARAHHAGDGATQDADRALDIFELACDAGEAFGCLVLGNRFALESPTDFAKALGFYQRACRMNDAAGCHAVGNAQAKGQGTGVDSGPAPDLHLRACNLGWGDACQVRAIAALSAKPPDIETGLPAMQRACALGAADACMEIAASARRGDHAPKNETHAMRFFAKACQKGRGDGCFEAGAAFHRGVGAAVNHRLALHYYERGCRAGNAGACVSAAGVLVSGTGVARDPARVSELTERACELDQKNCR